MRSWPSIIWPRPLVPRSRLMAASTEKSGAIFGRSVAPGIGLTDIGVAESGLRQEGREIGFTPPWNQASSPPTLLPTAPHRFEQVGGCTLRSRLTTQQRRQIRRQADPAELKRITPRQSISAPPI